MLGVKGLSLFGGGYDTGNLGVSALTSAFIGEVLARAPEMHISVFGHSRARERNGNIHFLGARWSRRIYQPDSLINIRIAARLGGAWNEGARIIRGSAALCDISGGDSFTDLYGMWRFKYITMPKLIALENRIPLILLPQTYGPFKSNEARGVAQRIVRGAAMAWARDVHSFQSLVDLLGDEFDPQKHRCGVDLAFLLDTVRPDAFPGAGENLLESSRDSGTPTAGINVSGLIYNQPERAREQYSLRLDYHQTIQSLILRMLRESNANIMLVPHVAPSRSDSIESDLRACQSVLHAVPADQRHRVVVAPALDDPRAVKWVIARCDWFCGTRMHATIAALSSGVPTAALAYSGKTQGVFETCGQGDHVADMRALTTEQAVERVWCSWSTRAEAKSSLQAVIPVVIERAEQQMDEILAAVTGCSAHEFCQLRLRNPRPMEPAE